MIGDKLRPIVEPVTRRVGRGLARTPLTPNALTTIGVLATLGVAGVLACGKPVLAGWLLIPVLLLDVLDGALARATDTVTRWGGYFDAVCDRVSDGAILAAVAWLGRGDETILAPAVIAAVTSGLVPYTRAKAEAFGFTPASGPGERLERSVLLIVGLVFDVLAPTLWIIIVITTYTATRRAWSVRAQARSTP